MMITTETLHTVCNEITIAVIALIVIACVPEINRKKPWRRRK